MREDALQFKAEIKFKRVSFINVLALLVSWIISGDVFRHFTRKSHMSLSRDFKQCLNVQISSDAVRLKTSQDQIIMSYTFILID